MVTGVRKIAMMAATAHGPAWKAFKKWWHRLAKERFRSKPVAYHPGVRAKGTATALPTR
ncbi:MAG: hypothetical protein WAO15_17920 [Mycobacterium sp.]